jgi:hypothetical protein
VGDSKLGLEVLNESQLSDGKKFRCVGNHIVGPESGASCAVQISESGLFCRGAGVHLLFFFSMNHLKVVLGKKPHRVRVT